MGVVELLSVSNSAGVGAGRWGTAKNRHLVTKTGFFRENLARPDDEVVPGCLISRSFVITAGRRSEQIVGTLKAVQAHGLGLLLAGRAAAVLLILAAVLDSRPAWEALTGNLDAIRPFSLLKGSQSIPFRMGVCLFYSTVVPNWDWLMRARVSGRRRQLGFADEAVIRCREVIVFTRAGRGPNTNPENENEASNA